MVDIHDPTATPTLHDPNYTLQSNINVAGLFDIRYTQLLIGVISNITSVMNIYCLTTTPTVFDPWLYSPEQYKHCQTVKKVSLHTRLLSFITIQYHNISDRYSWTQLPHSQSMHGLLGYTGALLRYINIAELFFLSIYKHCWVVLAYSCIIHATMNDIININIVGLF